MADRPGRNPYDRLAQQIASLQKQVIDLSTKDIVIPILDADPSTAYAGNIWCLPDGKLHVRLKTGTVKEYTPVTATAPGASNPAPVAQPTTRQSTWVAQWGQAYRDTGGFTGGNNSMLYQGSSGDDSYNGRQRSLIGFDYAAIQSALSGASVTAVSVWIAVEHTWYNSGGTFWFGMHNNTAKPGSWGGTIGRDFVTSSHVPHNGSLWINLATEFGSRLRDGTAKGITLQAPNSDRSYYGYAAGGPGTSAERLPQLRVTYVK